MGLFGNKREKCDKGDKYEYHSGSKGGRSGGGGYGPPALLAPPGASFFGGNQNYFDGYGQVGGQSKSGKYGKYGSPNKSQYGVDPMGQAMLMPPQSQAALQAQAQAIFSMQQYMQGQGQGQGGQFAGVLPPIQMPMQQAGLFQPQSQPFYGFNGQQGGTPFFDPNNALFQQQQPGAFAPYQQPNFYDPAAAAAFTAPYGYMPAAY